MSTEQPDPSADAKEPLGQSCSNGADGFPSSDDLRTDEPSAEEVVRRLDQLWSDAPSTRMPLHDQVGHQIGRYTIQQMIGSGGHGVVYRAHDTELDRVVALKIPRPEVLIDQDRRQRFVNEAQTAARLDHPAIVRVFEAELSGATPYIASAFCPGASLANWMDDANKQSEDQTTGTQHPGKEVAVFIEQLAQAVHYAHQNGVVHRDLKPSNVMLAWEEDSPETPQSLDGLQPRLTDFGLAQLSDGRAEDTRSSLMVGTPQYMSPEQASDRRMELGPATDIFSLGAILYHLLTGEPPFAAETYFGVLSRVREGTIVPVQNVCADVDQDLATICMKCLERAPEDRYTSAADLAEDLSRYRSGAPITARPLSAWQAVTRWSRHRLRVGEAMGAMILISAIRIAYAIFGLVIVRFVDGMSPTNAEVNEALAAHLLLTTPTEIWLIWAARRNLKRKLALPLYWITFVLLLVWSIATLLVAMDIAPAPLWYQRAPGARVMVLSIIGVLFLAQTACWYVADWARIDSPLVASKRHFAKRSVLGLAAAALLGAMLFSVMKPVRTPVFAGPSEFRQFDGIDDVVTIESVGFAESQSFTLEAWVRANDSRKAIIVQYGPISIGTVSTADGNRFRIQITNAPGSLYLVDTTEEFLNKEWAHLAITFDKEAMKCFLNGKPQDIRTTLYEWSDEDDGETQRLLESLPHPLVLNDVWPGSKVFIGSHKIEPEYGYFFEGQIGEVRLTRSVFYPSAFTPNPNLSIGPETEFLFRLNDQADEEFADETGEFIGQLHR